MKKVRRPWGFREQKSEALRKGGERCGSRSRWDEGIYGRDTARPYQCFSTAGEGREPLRRVRDFGSVASQAMKKVRRSWGFREQKSEALRKGGERCGSRSRWDEGIYGRDTARPYQSVGAAGEGRDPLRRVRDFGSMASQAMKKVRRPWDFRERKDEAFGKGIAASQQIAMGRRNLRTRHSASLPACVLRCGVSLPADSLNAASPGPCIRRIHQSGSHGILPHVEALVHVVAFAAEAMVKQSSLPAPCQIVAAFRKTILPEGCPAFHIHPGAWAFLRRGEKMQMIRHEEKITDVPCIRWVSPEFLQQRLHLFLGTPVATLLGTNRTPEQGCAIVGGQHPLGGCFSASKVFQHERKM